MMNKYQCLSHIWVMNNGYIIHSSLLMTQYLEHTDVNPKATTSAQRKGLLHFYFNGSFAWDH